ncbi:MULTISPECIES: sugar ABC transporter permease [unclassified Oceanispirochaeta]|uniref:ABC transporter permease n=1 Tax=unclassified Oceanispirochaeta TaxID=2635722 RepID=UPI000E099443|nr:MULTISPECIES: ABC transporter permease subunit [unclassified Oceanispirochaeta]MBF9017616.1 sugar ABC transporter permease [Oceanispirochaeta sp. M2]NPD74188.1 sugar ABC transporter permease [Oceanispirochaeta sp. M1]RDG30000.1 sugar ABC transporter permease [Oceanispirochaeta sp. M1]
MHGTAALTASHRKKVWKKIKRHWQYYLLLLPPLLFLLIFHYIPMTGLVMAFKKFSIHKGILGSPWAGLKYFRQFFSSPLCWILIRNTIGISLYTLIAGFPLPILLALGVNELKGEKFKKSVQMITYAPYFISTVVMVSIVMQMLHPRTGLLNIMITALGGEAINFMGEASMFKSIYVWSGIWQYTGYSAILYIAALAGIDPTLYEAAKMDGVSRLKRIIYIDIPGIIPTIIILLILNVGNLMNIGFEKIFLMQNDLNLVSSEIISTYIYKVGLRHAQFSFSTAIGFFNSIINFTLLVTVNRLARKYSEVSLW